MQWASGHAERATSAADAEGGDTPASIGRTPDAVFCCAGGAKPGYFIQQTEDDFQAGIKTDYMTALSTAHAAATALAASGKRGARIVLVSSTLGLMGLVGYAQYSPMKFAIRGLAETLRSELQLYGIHVHCYFPGTILSPGYDAENRTKPELTKKLEGGPEEGLTPQQCAAGLLRGVASGRFYITTDFQTELFRAASAGGSVPGNGWLADRVKAFIALVSGAGVSGSNIVSPHASDPDAFSGTSSPPPRSACPSGAASSPTGRSSPTPRPTRKRLASAPAPAP